MISEYNHSDFSPEFSRNLLKSVCFFSLSLMLISAARNKFGAQLLQNFGRSVNVLTSETITNTHDIVNLILDLEI